MARDRKSGSKYRKNPSNESSELVFREMLLQAKSLLMTSFDEFQLRKRFTNLSAETIFNFLKIALARGIIIKERQFGTFICLEPTLIENTTFRRYNRSIHVAV